MAMLIRLTREQKTVMAYLTSVPGIQDSARDIAIATGHGELPQRALRAGAVGATLAALERKGLVQYTKYQGKKYWQAA